MIQTLFFRRFLDRRRTLLVMAGAAMAPALAYAASAGQIAAEGRAALEALYAGDGKARDLGRRSKAILVFPKIIKAGAIVGGQRGEGVLIVDGKVQGFYRISAASFGYQAGAQRFGYALFFVTDSALDYLRSSKGWSVGTGPSLVLVDSSYAKTINTTTLQKDVYAMSFDRKGLMAGTGLEGSKITQFTPDP